MPSLRSPQMIEAIFFDFYNTLVRFWPPLPQIQHAACQNLGIRVPAERLSHGYAIADLYFNEENHRWPLGERDPASRDEFFARYEQIILQESGVAVSLRMAKQIWDMAISVPKEFVEFEETRPVLKELNGRGYRLAVLTNLRRDMEELTQRHEHAGEPGEVRLEVLGLTNPGVFEDINLEIHAGEIVGLAGLVGAGRSEVARALFGLDRYSKGKVKVNGQTLTGGSVKQAMSAGLSLVPEDRQHEGLILPMSVGANLSMAVLDKLTNRGLVDPRLERGRVDKLMSDLLIKAANQDVPAETLSGGNQQKLVIGKWIAAKPQVLILDEPTRGVDIAAKAQVHRLIRNLASKGLATLIISSDMNEILSISDRIVVMREGRISGEIPGREATRELVLELALPQEKEVLA